MLGEGICVNNDDMNDDRGGIRLAEVTERVIETTFLEALVVDARAGAIVSFSGNVRDHDHGRSVRTLSYEGHPLCSSGAY